MPTPFHVLCELLERVEATKKRLDITEHTARFLQTLDGDEVEPAVNLIVGRGFPRYSQKTLDVSWATLRRILEQISDFDWQLFRSAMAKTGDIGSATRMVLEQSRGKLQLQLTQNPLSILEVRRTLEAIADTKGAKSRTKKERLITALLSQATPVEAKYLVKVFTGEMRTGLHEGLMEQAVAHAFGVALSRVQHAAMVIGDIGEVAAKIRAEGNESLEQAGFQVFRPVQLMLAQTADSVEQALELQGGTSAFEYKYDGARVQIHKRGSEVRIFSRRLTDVTESLPEVVKVVQQNILADTAIIEGEVIAFDSAGYPIAFQHLMRRFKRTRALKELQERIPLTLYLFDILFLNGESTIAKPSVERRQLLAQNAGQIALSNQIVTSQPTEAQDYLKEALAAGHEGLMAKKPDSPYLPGRRGNRWLKIKPTLEPLDLVITAAEYGYGRRREWLSDYYLGALDPETGEFVNIGKTFKGLTDAELTELTARLKEIAVNQQGHKVTVLPRIVVEVAYNEIQQSPKYPSQMALRFARITRIRDDKSPEEASRIGQVKAIYERQFKTKGKFIHGAEGK
jgi:DNA ligase-1